MKSKLKKITYLVIGLLIAFLPTNTLIFNEGAQTELSIPKQSADDDDIIFIDDSKTGVGANNWTWAAGEDWCSGSGTWNDPYIIENLKISGFGAGYGIYITNSNVSFIIQDCLIYNSNEGIYLENVNNSRLINNNCSNIGWGIKLEYSNNNTVSGNTANGNDYEGIYIEYANNNTLSGNTANDNGDVGIHLFDHCSNNIISGNTANGNTVEGGIYLEDNCSNNNITGNTATDNDYGIHIYSRSSNNTISGNTANGNLVEGIYLWDNSEYNDVIDNIFYNNTLGIRIDSGCYNNSIYQNFFLENGKHAEDDGTDNTWNSTTIGNYWDNWTTPDISPNDGIVDLQYNISGSAESIDYLPIAEDGAPSITINSPTSSDVFAVTAPSFDVTITDDYLDEMWYTIDGGINNYTFIENAIINQTAWAAKTQGSVTITFYASDIPRNIGIAEVSVVKDTTAPIIVINSPTDGAEFGTQAPLFNITVTDDHLDSMWYSFDGGVTTFTINDNTVFNQTAWTALPEGDVTITFYANDTLGHEASEAVTVVKTAAGLDPGVIITIVVVSISGGVAVAAVIFIYLKKRASPK